MSVNIATASRRFQFVAGPESQTFYACPQHLKDLHGAWYPNGLFFGLDRWMVQPVHPSQELECDSCRGEDGP